MKKRTAWIKRMGTVLILISIFAASCIPVKAADMTDCIGLVIGYDSDGEVVYASPGIPVNVNGTLGVYADTYDIDSGEVTVAGLAVSNEVYKLVYGDTGALITGYDYEATIWVLEEEQQNTENDIFLQLGKAHQNETVTAVYLNRDNERATMAMTLLECSEDGFVTADNYPTNLYYPAALVNESREFVGIILEDDVVYAVGGDSEAFYAEGDEAPQEEETLAEPGESIAEEEPKAAPLPPREERVPETEEASEPAAAEETSEPVIAKPAAQQGKSSSSSQSGALAGVLIGIAAAAAIVIFICVVRSRKKKTETVRKEMLPQVEDTGKTMPFEEGTENIPAFEKAAENKAVQQPKLWLAAVGGYMNGRVYPVEKDEITIGRDAASAIRYPADTAGVSRVHAKLYWQNGQLMLMDCNSTSGTYLKRQGKLAPMQPAAVQSGDIFYIGEKTNSFEIKN